MALFTARSEFQIGVCGANKHPMLPWKQWSKDVNKVRFVPPEDLPACQIWVGVKIFISHFVWFLQRSVLNIRLKSAASKKTVFYLSIYFFYLLIYLFLFFALIKSARKHDAHNYAIPQTLSSFCLHRNCSTGQPRVKNENNNGKVFAISR